MTPAQLESARAVVLAPGWAWRAGMRAFWPEHGTGWRILDGETSWYERERIEDALPTGLGVPDLDDGATRGAMLDLARTIHGDPTLCVRPLRWPRGDVAGWTVCDHADTVIADGTLRSEGEALCAAILACPK